MSIARVEDYLRWFIFCSSQVKGQLEANLRDSFLIDGMNSVIKIRVAYVRSVRDHFAQIAIGNEATPADIAMRGITESLALEIDLQEKTPMFTRMVCGESTKEVVVVFSPIHPYDRTDFLIGFLLKFGLFECENSLFRRGAPLLELYI